MHVWRTSMAWPADCSTEMPCSFRAVAQIAYPASLQLTLRARLTLHTAEGSDAFGCRSLIGLALVHVPSSTTTGAAHIVIKFVMVIQQAFQKHQHQCRHERHHPNLPVETTALYCHFQCSTSARITTCCQLTFPTRLLLLASRISC